MSASAPPTDALQASYDAYRDLAENARDFLWTADLTGRLTYVNESTARLLGAAPAALVGRSTFEFITDHPDNLDIAATLAKVAAGEAMPPQPIECTTTRGPRWFEVAGSGIRDRQRAGRRLRAIGRDITERRAAEDGATPRRGRAPRERSPLPRHRRVDAGGLHADRSRGPAALRERRDLPPDRRAARRDARPELLPVGASGRPGRDPRQHGGGACSRPTASWSRTACRRCRGWRWFEWEACAIRDADGQIREFQTIGLDVTERKEAERALETSEARYRSLVESGLELIARADPSGRLLFANDAYLRAFGYRREDVEAGRATILPHIHEDDRARVLESFERVQQPPYRNVIVNRVRIGDTWRWFEWEQGVVRDEHGVITEIQGAGRDVTERHVAEEALRRSLEELKRSEETLRRLARRQAAIREEERRRLGLDLHDNVCQELAAVGVLLEAARVRKGEGSELARATRHLTEVIEHLRLVGRDLRPMMLSDLGLTESLRAFTTKVSSLQRRVGGALSDPDPAPRRRDRDRRLPRRAGGARERAPPRRRAQHRSPPAQRRRTRLVLEVRDDGRGFDRTRAPHRLARSRQHGRARARARRPPRDRRQPRPGNLRAAGVSVEGAESRERRVTRGVSTSRTPSYN